MAFHRARTTVLLLAFAAAGCSSGGSVTTAAPRAAGPPGPAAPAGTASATPAPLPSDAVRTTRPRAGRSARVYGRWGRPVLYDDFGGDRLNPRTWQVYDARGALSHPGSPAGVHVADGRLRLVGGLYGGKDQSAGVVSRLAQTYGRWEARLRADRGNGYSATAFLWPTRLGSPEWAEIDFAEIIDGTRRTGGLFIHHGPDDRQLMRIAHVDFTRWHTVAVDWLPSRLTFWVDGKAVWTYQGPFVPKQADMHLNLRNETADGFRRLASTPRRVTMEVDWVRVFRAPEITR
ncbi:glycoside hydrolase family 16 protein [Actinoallomurus purpureus]|uniref:glycoside hydrolase family 16 protein n=1 Tax=Actinoallomurus purpureus TaxID=478114 RepID=UPI00209346FA|nr:glycoside hydrolase family 16 protein [Actinoallomurus purpureus]MCO6009519.1 glycoside hydrolase family 16 protein [Actinoallomurus purpureus]